MKFIDKIDKCIEEKLSVFVNGMPEDGGGTIIKREDDFIVFEVLNESEKQEDVTKERINIPVAQIYSLSSGERKASILSTVLKE